ncbi:uncharacterized protein [Amphiura filiformis]|uniref:uncharacterized protein n=1 Tax=Amphiura filiformis TaxID=82378 RepID=UPI003B21271E
MAFGLLHSICSSVYGEGSLYLDSSVPYPFCCLPFEMDGRILLAVATVAVLFFTGASGTPEPGDVQLVGGDNARIGRLEFYIDQWYTVCDNGFGLDEAEVICRQLGHSTDHAVPVYDGPWADGTGKIANITNCPASGNTVDDCNYDGDDSILSSSAGNSVKPYQCLHNEDVGVHCIEGEDPMPELRLVGGTSSYSGRVEINVAGSWGTICSSSYDNDDAKVICRQLGLPHRHANVYSVFPEGTGDIIYSDLRCNGDEERIDFCDHHEYPTDASCQHDDDIGIICTNHAHFDEDHIRTYDGVLDGGSIVERFFRIQEGAIVKFICATQQAGGLNTLDNDHMDIEWELGQQVVTSDNTDGIDIKEYVQMYQSNGLGFNGRKGKRLSTMVYTARKEDNLKTINCDFIDEDEYDSVLVSSVPERILLLVLPGPEPQHFETTVGDQVWIGGFVGEIHIPITSYYNSWKIVLEFPKKVFRLYGGNFNIAHEPCLHRGSCTQSKYTWIIYNTYENRVLSPLKDLHLSFVADVSKKLRGGRGGKGRGRGIVADVKFYGYNKVFGSDKEPIYEPIA